MIMLWSRNLDKYVNLDGGFGGYTNLIAEIRKAAALIGEGRVVHNVPVKNIEFTVGHGILTTKNTRES